MLKKFAELGTVHRGEPCQEYPGSWFSYVNGDEEKEFPSFEAALQDAYQRQNQRPFSNTETSVCWKASDNDPRIGEVWFTGFYQHGKYNIFGNYVES